MSTGLLFALFCLFFFLTLRYDLNISYQKLSKHQKDFILNSYKFTDAKIRNIGKKGMIQRLGKRRAEVKKTNYHPI